MIIQEARAVIFWNLIKTCQGGEFIFLLSRQYEICNKKYVGEPKCTIKQPDWFRGRCSTPKRENFQVYKTVLCNQLPYLKTYAVDLPCKIHENPTFLLGVDSIFSLLTLCP